MRITHNARITGSNAAALAANLGPVLTRGILDQRLWPWYGSGTVRTEEPGVP